MHILFHIEHTLAQNIRLDRALTSQHVREHARRRSELCRSDGNLWGIFWQKTTDRHYWTVRPATWSASLQQILQLLELYRRSDDDAGTPVFTARGYAQCHVHGQVVHSVPAMWERQCDALDVTNFQGLAPPSSERRSDPAVEINFVSHPHRRAFEAGTHAEARCTRRHLDDRIENTPNSDHVQSLDFSWLGSQYKVSQTYETRSIEFHSIGRDVEAHSTVDLEARDDPKVCSHEAATQGLDTR